MRFKLFKRKSHKIPVKVNKESCLLKDIGYIEDVLSLDSVNNIMRDLDKIKPHISDMVVIWLDKRDNRYYYQFTPETLSSTATWLLENTKLDVLNNEDSE
jgi:hypothetical protein